MKNELQQLQEQVKKNISSLAANGELEKAQQLLNEYTDMVSDDVEVFSMQAVIGIHAGQLVMARNAIEAGLKLDDRNFDLLYNLAYIFELHQQYAEAASTYGQLTGPAYHSGQQTLAQEALQRVNGHLPELQIPKKKIVFFVKSGMDSFLGNLVDGLADQYETEKVIVENQRQLDEGMKRADICWFEWCDELLAYGSQVKLAHTKIIICRLHRYEAFSESIHRVAWANVDKVIFVSNHICDVVRSKVQLPMEKCVIIPNGINFEQFTFSDRKKGYHLAWIGYLNLRKNPMLTLQYLYELVKIDSRYQLHIAGSFQDETLKYYMQDMIKKLNLQNNVHFAGFIPNTQMSDWLRDKHYIVTGSIAEGHPVGVMEAMASGLKPAIHYFPGVESFYPKKYIYYNLDDFKRIVMEDEFDSQGVSNYIKNRYPVSAQLQKINTLLGSLLNYDHNILKWVKGKLQTQQVVDGNEDITVLIPTYNRGEMVIKDLEMGYKVGMVPKVVVDDCSHRRYRPVLQKLNRNKEKYGITTVISHEKNQGVAAAIITGLQQIDTSMTMFLDDDDMVLCKNRSLLTGSIAEADSDTVMIAPRYAIHLFENGEVSIGYDRNLFSQRLGSEALVHLFQSGELYTLNAGAIYATDSVKESLSEELFIVSEDYVRVTRILGKNLNKKIRISEEYVHVRRISNDSLSKALTPHKLSLHLLSLLISGYYCLHNQLLSKSEVITAILNRGKLLQSLYQFGEEFTQQMVGYLQGELFIDAFKHVIGEHAVPQEFLKIRDEINT